LVVVAVGTLLLLDMQCEAFSKLVKPSQINHASKKRKRVATTYDSLGIPVPASIETQEEVLDEDSDRFIQVCDVFAMFLRCLWSLFTMFVEQVRLDVPRNFTAVHGKLYVSIHVRYEVSRCTEDIRSIYVNPEDLVIPSAKQTEKAHKCFYV
jgi:hypothetical protein